MASGRIDAIALTNLGQIRRLIEVARAHGFEARLREGLAKTPIASVGPAVSDELKSHGLRTDIYPANDAFFMKPLISAMAAALGKSPPRNAAASDEVTTVIARSEAIDSNPQRTSLDCFVLRSCNDGRTLLSAPASIRPDTPDRQA